MNTLSASEKGVLKKERSELLQQVEDWLETPMLVLGFAWLALLVVDLMWGLSPLLQVMSNVIWILFILDFAVRFTLAPHKLVYLKQSWLTVISLVLPARARLPYRAGAASTTGYPLFAVSTYYRFPQSRDACA